MQARFVFLAFAFAVFLAFAVALVACRDNATPPPRNEHKSTTIASPAPAARGELQGTTIAFLATDGFEEVELVKTQQMFADRAAKTVVVAPKLGTIQGYNHRDAGDKVLVDVELDDADPSTFDALVLPGGVANPDELRMDPRALRFVRSFAEARKPIAAICHAPWLLVEAGLVRDRTVTSWPSLKTDLLNAGATWLDRDVIVDRGIVTSRKPEDIDAFVKKTTDELLAHPAKHAMSRTQWRRAVLGLGRAAPTRTEQSSRSEREVDSVFGEAR